MVTYRSMSTETVTLLGHNGDKIDAYVAHPDGPAPRAGVIVVHHMPGWDEWSMEVVRRLAHHGYTAICPNLHHRQGPGTADEMSVRVRDDGGQRDEFVLGDLLSAEAYLRGLDTSNDRVGIIGFCSGGRVVYMAACKMPSLDAAVDCWGGNVVSPPFEPTPNQPETIFDMTPSMEVPLLGIFGNDDKNPSPTDVDAMDAELTRLGKEHEFHRYDGAGHGFFAWERGGYRPEQAVDAWGKVWEFYERHLG